MKRSIVYSAAALVFLALSCTPYDNSIPDWPWADPSDPDPEWTDVTSSFGKLSDGIRVLKAPDRLRGQNAVAYAAVVDLSKASFDVWSIYNPDLDGTDEAFMTPSKFYSENGKPSIVINGGFFYEDSGTYYTSSLAVIGGKLYSPNINYASEDWISIYYPTRAAFIEHNDGSFETGWTYYHDADAHYLYSSPAQNSWASTPLMVPDATFPCEAASLNAKTAIGGGPVLIKDGKIVNSYRQELFDGPTGIMCDERHPRTAIGITADGKLVLFVCEGRDMTEGVPGYKTEEVARLMKGLGCVEAMNLDGGGSSCMLVGGSETIKPSDGSQRAVASFVYIK
ncbi:MAG: phosphodiester glycosidase family protein [Bacteroidales bacterium]|nr:phosphodiester glycosidase family protein [Candidatus Cryptobacteroides choladohippi]MCQ2179488.1 phosphodiester glycosidase family protein [Bacteroidales bacterium]